MNCINCSKVFHLYEQCEYASPEVKECKYYEKIERKVYKNVKDNFNNNISFMDRNVAKHN